MIKKAIAFVERILDLAGGFLGGVVAATLCSAFTFYLIKETASPLSYLILTSLLYYILFPLLGLLKRNFFILYIAPVASAFGSEEGMEFPEDDGHSWRATVLMIVFLLSSIALFIGALLQIGSIVYISAIAIAIYSFLAPRTYKTEKSNQSLLDNA